MPNIHDPWRRLLYVTFPLWIPFHLLWVGEDLRLVARAFMWAPVLFVVGVFLHGGIAILDLIERMKR